METPIKKEKLSEEDITKLLLIDEIIDLQTKHSNNYEFG